MKGHMAKYDTSRGNLVRQSMEQKNDEGLARALDQTTKEIHAMKPAERAKLTAEARKVLRPKRN
jgi:hypothetical protein